MAGCARAVRVLVACIGLAGAAGCTSVHCYRSAPQDVHLRIAGAEREPARWIVVVRASDQAGAQPDADGRVTLSIALSGCRVYRLGLLVRHTDPRRAAVVHVQRDGIDMRVLSLADSEALPLDEEGCHLLDPDA